jgi:hypothetical protein
MRAALARWIAVLVAGALALAPSPVLVAPAPARQPDLPALLAEAASYLDIYEPRFSAIVAREDYELSMLSGLIDTRDTGFGTARRTVLRKLRSDLMLLNLGPADWVQFRDVYEVDGKPVRDHERQLEALLAKPASGLLDAGRKIADESARYNLGVQRNFNVPTMALAYLARKNQARSAFTVKSHETIDGPDLTVVEFKETAHPGLIQADRGEVTTNGRFWIAPQSGAVVRSELSCRVDRGSTWVEGTVTVNYKSDRAVPVLVPATMDEQYRRDTGETDTGHALYADFRSFRVDTQTIRKGGGGGPAS